MALQIDFTRDVAQRCIEKLTEAGYTPNPADDEDAIYTYCTIRHRRVRPQPRIVHRAKYAVPPHLVVGEQQLLAKVESGGDLWPHQSRKIDKLSVEDGMLNDYGIQHFHLGTTPDSRRPHLIAGTKELLFALVRDDHFYAIGVYDHGAWSKRVILDVVHANWPSLTEPYTVKGVHGLQHHYTDEEAAQLRTSGINVLQQRPDGSVQMGLGGGIASDGSSIVVRRDTDRMIIHIQALEAAVEATLSNMVIAGNLPADAAIRVVWNGDGIYAVTNPPIVRVNLTNRLVIPPL